jgi:hypothetical protein
MSNIFEHVNVPTPFGSGPCASQEAWCIENLGFAKPLVLRLSQDGHMEDTSKIDRLVSNFNADLVMDG